MGNNKSSLLCSLGGWGLAILAGLLGAVLLMIMGEWRLIQAIFAAVVITILVGGFMTWVICRPLPALGEVPESKSVPNPVPSSQESAAKAAAQAREGAQPAPATPAAVAATAARGGLKPSAPLAGEADLAARKGSWSYDGNAASDADASKDAAAEKAAADKAAADKAAADKAAAEKAAADKAAADKAAAEKAAADKAKAEKAEASKAAAAKSAPTAEGEDNDGDGVREGNAEGTRPQAMDGPRDGKADNLKEIKGIGPKLELLCHTLGFFHFDQIAGWSADEVAWVDANLEGFKGRVSRDKWVEQAGILAAGGDTEFSKRVDDGNVY